MLNLPETLDQLIQNVIVTLVKIIRVLIFVTYLKQEKHFGLRLTSYHNLHFLLKLMEKVRQAIREDRLLDFREEFFEEYGFNKPNAKNF